MANAMALELRRRPHRIASIQRIETADDQQTHQPHNEGPHRIASIQRIETEACQPAPSGVHRKSPSHCLYSED